MKRFLKDEKRLIADAAAERERAKPQFTGWKPDVGFSDRHCRSRLRDHSSHWPSPFKLGPERQ